MARNQPASGGKRTSSQTAAGRSSANRKYAQRQAAKQQAVLAARKNRNRTVGIGSVVIVVIIVVVLIVVKVTGGGSSSTGGSTSSPAMGTPISAAITTKLASIPLSTLTVAPTNGLSTSPQSISDPALKADDKPELLYIGAEFCPICAAERWPLYIALSKFGTFSPEPGRIHSALRDGNIATLTFYKTTYTSPYLSFTPVETTTNQPDGNYYVTLQTPTPAQQKLWTSHTSQSFPWLDFGGKAELTSAQYDPTHLEGVSFNNIASVVGNNSTAIGTDIDASAKVLIQTICRTLTTHKPVAVCSAVGDG
jgi:preprotein translocase subunit SecG